MTPSARLSAAITILDTIRTGVPAEQALTNWARASRYAGSGDRAMVRDHVFDVLRCRGSLAWVWGLEPDAASGRSLVLALMARQGADLTALFTGEGHAPAPVSAPEAACLARVVGQDADAALDWPALDWPAWLRADLIRDLGAEFASVSLAMQERAAVFLRVNLRRCDVAQAQARLAAEGIATEPHSEVATALRVIDGARRIQSCAAYAEGLVELQDASSQNAVAMVPVADGATVLDYCAGGGGKALALAARVPLARITAHDVDAARMRDIPARAKRAGARISIAKPGAVTGAFDVVMVDAPCSGSGTWRRTPDAKWRMTPEGLGRLIALQSDILHRAAERVAPGGSLVYMTCSVLWLENEDQVNTCAANLGFRIALQKRMSPGPWGDGFFIAIMHREA